MGKQVRPVPAPQDALPVNAAVVEFGVVLYGVAGEVAAVGDAGHVSELWLLAVPPLDRRLGSPRELLDSAVPLRDRAAGLGSVIVETGTGVALVGGGEGVPSREYKVADDEVESVLLAHPGGAGDHQLAVPILRQADHELRVVARESVLVIVAVGLGVVGEVAVDLNARDQLSTGRVHGFGGMKSRPVVGLGVIQSRSQREGAGGQSGAPVRVLVLRPRRRGGLRVRGM